ncbi:MarP family serine protease [Nocardioides panacisoli]|uniref:MarP family serine protease n=1 Tax=Nocardioides panacisoli TaxID=627624 RepID=UPI001C62F217|nr:MarP family serine protease [Nocardioides panacisoli]QYJ03702.1 MarP family serine protease [Nocardioides panacisoli]
MNFLDVLLLLLVLAYALSGYWQGFITGAFATVGLLAGGLFGIWLAPIALSGVEPSIWVSLGALFIVILSASLGQAVLQYAGSKVREKVTWQPARFLDALGGAALSAFAVLLVAWALGVAVSGTRIVGVTEQVRNSQVLSKVNEVLPSSAPSALGAFNNVVGLGFFPRYLEPFAPERIVEVGPGPRRVLEDPDVVAARRSVLKVRGTNVCGRGVEGTGFIYEDNRVMTNAHVVAGVREPVVEIGQERVPAQVVAFDSDLDIAVLRLDTQDLPSLQFDIQGGPAAEARDPVAVLGYPEDGPYDAQPGRIRSEQRLRSPDIYGRGTVLRDVYSIRSLVRPGNSGGPIVTEDGDVAGVVFAASVTDNETGYAVTAGQVSEIADASRDDTSPASTGDCAA